MEAGFEIRNATVSRAGREIFRDVSFSLLPGEALLLSGPNGVGKSTLAFAVLGHPDCVFQSGGVVFGGEDIRGFSTFERARRGIFLAHQEPPAISGVTVSDVLRGAVEAQEGDAFSYPKFTERLRAALSGLQLTYDFAKKEMHSAFSGGEKKKIELLSLLLLKPKLAILDEIDAGMDEETRGLLVTTLERLQNEGMMFILISHNQHIFDKLPRLKSFILQAQKNA